MSDDIVEDEDEDEATPACPECGGTEFQVRYSVLVWATVEMSDDAVTSVNVDDENVKGPTTVECISCEHGAAGDLRDAVIKVAENSDWPGWEFGW